MPLVASPQVEGCPKLRLSNQHDLRMHLRRSKDPGEQTLARDAAKVE